MTISTGLRQEIATLSPSSVIELFELQLIEAIHGSTQLYRFHAGVNGKTTPGAIVWDGEEYQPWPIEAEGFEYDNSGKLPRPRVRIGNVDGSISLILLEINALSPNNDLCGARVTRIRTTARFLDAVNFSDDTNPFGTPDPTAKFPDEIYFIDRKSAESPELIEFELATPFDLAGVTVPKRKMLKSRCPFVYRSGEGCDYTGTSYFTETNEVTLEESEDVCGKSQKACKLRFGENAELPFGAYPGIGNFLS